MVHSAGCLATLAGLSFVGSRTADVQDSILTWLVQTRHHQGLRADTLN